MTGPNTLLYPEEARWAGNAAYELARQLFAIPRSLTGPGVERTLEVIDHELGGLLDVHKVPSGTRVCDWVVPPEWRITDGFIETPDGDRIAVYGDNPLHVVGYSIPVDRRISLHELQDHLYSLPEQPEAIPYVTTYYRRSWGFCLKDSVRQKLRPGEYRVVIDASLDEDGDMTYADALLPGESEREVFLSTYVCHPNLANNELSGPTVLTQLVKWLLAKERRTYTYRVVFAPETIGALVYLDQHRAILKERTIAAFNLTCVGDDRQFSFLPSKDGDTIADRIGRHVLRHLDARYVEHPFSARGSDERQYCSPQVDLPLVSLMRSKYATYPEYHTSHDDLGLISPSGLAGGYAANRRAVECLEANGTPVAVCVGEPNLGRRDLYPTVSRRDAEYRRGEVLLDILMYADGTTDLLEIAERLDMPMWQLSQYAAVLAEEELLVWLPDSQIGTESRED